MKLYSFWAINAPLDVERLSAQLAELRAAGFSGAVFQPRFYSPPPKYLSPEWIAALDALFAANTDLELSIQDENGWPAPSVDGELLRQAPYLRQSWVAAYPQRAGLENIVAAAGDLVFVREWGQYADTLNPETTTRFIDLTYEPHLALRRWFGRPFTGFFCDEPQFGPLDATGHNDGVTASLGAIAWTDDLPEAYQARTGRDLLADLPALFTDRPESAAARIAFYETTSDLFRERFVEPLIAWCDAHGIRWSGHYKGEEHPYFQLWFCGPLGPLFRAMRHVGLDSLERYPGERYFMRQSASLMRQEGMPGMVECCGGGGWGMRAGDVFAYLAWLGMHGFTELVLHLAQYQLTPLALHDWPPSVPFHQPYAGCFPALIERLRATIPTTPVDHRLLVVVPYRGLMARLTPSERSVMDVHKATRYADSPAGNLNTRVLDLLHRLDDALIGYDVVSEREFEELAVLDGAGVVVGACRYRQVLLTEGCVFATGGQTKLAAMGQRAIDLREGGEIDFLALAGALELPTHAAAHPTPVIGDCFGEGDDAQLLLVNAQRQPETVSLPQGALTLLPGEVMATPVNALPKPHETVSTEWAYTAELLDENVLPIDRLEGDGAAFRTTIRVADPLADASLVSIVPLHELALDGVVIPLVEDGYFRYPELRQYRLPELTAGAHVLAITLTEPWPEPMPFIVWLAGPFGVRSAAPWAAGGNGALRAEGPFTLTAPGAVNGASLVESGYPFYSGGVRYRGDMAIDRPGSGFALHDVHGAAARVLLDGEEIGWTWGPRWEIDADITAGTHTLTVELYTTSFNLFGPHHHICGDSPIVSSSHYTGVRDFAQPPEEPVLLIEVMHVQPTGLAPRVTIFGEA